MQTLYTIEDKETGGVRTELHVSTYTKYGLYVTIYRSDEWGTHIGTIKKRFLYAVEYLYHKHLRTKIVSEGGIIHKRISGTPLPKTHVHESEYPDRDNRGRFIKKK